MRHAANEQQSRSLARAGRVLHGSCIHGPQREHLAVPGQAAISKVTVHCFSLIFRGIQNYVGISPRPLFHHSHQQTLPMIGKGGLGRSTHQLQPQIVDVVPVIEMSTGNRRAQDR